MEKPKLRWMIWSGSPSFRKPPSIQICDKLGWSITSIPMGPINGNDEIKKTHRFPGFGDVQKKKNVPLGFCIFMKFKP